MNYDFDLIIIGGGSAGLSLASLSARAGVSVALIDAEDLGGDCLHYGCVPSKALIHSGKVAHTINSSAKYGIDASINSIDWQSVTKRVADVVQTISDHKDNAERFEAMGCTVFTDTKGKFVDPHTIDVGSKHITGKYIAICTGTAPRKPKLPGIEKVEYLTNEQLFFLQKQPKSLLVVGSGPIGCELSQAMQRLGTQVTLINNNDSILSREDKDVQAVVRECLLSDGITIENFVKAESIEQKDGQVHLHVDQNGTKKTLSAEQILYAIGREHTTSSLNLEAAGVRTTERGAVVVNKKLQTNVKHIFAAGDCTGLPQFTHSAGAQAGVVFSNVVLKFPSKFDPHSIPWTTFTDPEIASTGLNELRAKQQEVEYTVTKLPFSHQDRALAAGTTKGFIKVLSDKKGHIVGCQITGSNAGELIHEWVIAMKNKVKLSTIARSIHVYPTLSGINQEVAGLYSGKKLFTARLRNILRTLFGYRNTKIESFSE